MAETTIIGQLPQLLSSIAPLLWPILALVALLLFRPQLNNLLTRIREGGGVKFYPQTQPNQPSSDILPNTDESASSSTFPRTPATRELEDVILRIPAVAGRTEPLARAQVLTTVAARAFLIGFFEQVEAAIWASQIDLLSHLHAAPDGVSREHIQRYFYEPAVSRLAATLASYSFDSYLNFLVSFNFVDASGGRVLITNRGREYLTWRVESRKPPKTFG